MYMCILHLPTFSAHSPVSGGTEKEAVAEVELLPSGDFRIATYCLFVCVMHVCVVYVGVETCRRRLLSVARLPGVNPEASPEERLVQVSSLLPLDAVNLVRDFSNIVWKSSLEDNLLLSSPPPPFLPSLPQVRSVGALLKYIEKKRLGVELEDEGVRVPILAVKHFSL